MVGVVEITETGAGEGMAGTKIRRSSRGGRADIELLLGRPDGLGTANGGLDPAEPQTGWSDGHTGKRGIGTEKGGG